MPTNPEHLRPPEIDSRAFLRYYAQRKRRLREPVQCLQIGANDGVTKDPVNPYLQGFGWHGLLVEPLPAVFAGPLSKTYAGNPRVALANVAIAPDEGVMPLYRVGISDARWATGLSSFCRESIEEHIENGYIEKKARQEGVDLPDDPEQIIDVVEVRTTTVERLLDQHEVEHFDVLCIDTEGFDYEILKLVDLDRFTPEVIFFESKNLSDEDFTEVQATLRAHGYTLYWDNGDTIATTVPYARRAELRTQRRIRVEGKLRAAKRRVRSVL